MNKYAIIQNGLVINYIEYETQPDNPPPSFEEGTIAVLNNSVGVGYTYNNGVFTEPQPYASWILVNNKWTAPTAKPNDGKIYMWDEETISWKGLA
jgi:hypothetical protein